MGFRNDIPNAGEMSDNRLNTRGFSFKNVSVRITLARTGLSISMVGRGELKLGISYYDPTEPRSSSPGLRETARAVLDIKRWYKNTNRKTPSEALSQGQIRTALQLPGVECGIPGLGKTTDSHPCPTDSLWRRLCGWSELGIVVTV